MIHGPRRIVCLTEETTETLYRIGEQDRIVGISGFTVRPPQARKEKPRVSAFTSARLDRIKALDPDLVLGFSNLQADIAASLVRDGIAVHVFNQRSVAEIFEFIALLGAMVRANAQTQVLIDALQRGIDEVADAAAGLAHRARVYFEEWDEPMISGIGWVSELIGIAGGQDVFPELAAEHSAGKRIIDDPAEVVRRAPELIVGSWCGKKFRPEKLAGRPGWAVIPAVRDGQLKEIKSCDILQPGPAALGDGLRQLHRLIADLASR
ncbi:MAG: ABC transporter substrate-binding protein [Panacagrimonas sp.]